MEKLYLTNNICESINSKINLYLPKKVTSNSDFVNCLTKIFINNKFANKDIIRHDYITRSLIKIINEKNLNENLTWIKYEAIIKMQKNIISCNEDDYQEDDINKLISVLNNLEIDDNEDPISEERNAISYNSEDIIEGNEDHFIDNNISNSYSEEDIRSNKINENIINNNDNEINNLDNSFIDILSEDDSNNNIDLFTENSNMDDDNLVDKNESFYKLPFKERLKIRIKEKEKEKEKNKPKNKPKKRKKIYPKNEYSDEDEKNNIINVDKFKKKKTYP